MLELTRFKALIASYGTDLHRWPEEVRIDATALLLVSAPARALRDAARSVDAAIDAAGARGDAIYWRPGEQGAAAMRLRAAVQTRIAGS